MGCHRKRHAGQRWKAVTQTVDAGLVARRGAVFVG